MKKSWIVGVLSVVLTLTAVSSHSRSAEVVQFRLELSDLAGNPISQIGLGESFLLRTYVQDLRNDPTGGVFAAYLDIDYQAALASASLPVVYGEKYQNGKNADLSTDGVLNDIGAFSSNDGTGLTPIGVGENLVFEVTLQAISSGELTFIGRDAANSPFFDVLVYNSNDVVSPSDIIFNGTTGTIGYGSAGIRVSAVPEPSIAGVTAIGFAALVLRRRRQRSID